MELPEDTNEANVPVVHRRIARRCSLRPYPCEEPGAPNHSAPWPSWNGHRGAMRDLGRRKESEPGTCSIRLPRRKALGSATECRAVRYQRPTYPG